MKTVEVGITPAPAGNTLSSCCRRSSSRDHPRACGKHSPNTLDGQRQQGSPPRLRETPRR